MPAQDLLALAVSFGLALIWLRLNNFLAARGWISSGLSRKIIHIGTGPLFVLTWLLYSDAPSARFLAALVPLAITAQFALVGLGLWKDPSAVTAMSRSGDRREILRGPLYYGIAFVALTLIFWKDRPEGVVALMLLCGGDGLADIVGRQVGGARLPWSPRKTWAGSLAMLAGGWLTAALVLGVFTAAGRLGGVWSALLPGLGLTALGATLIESLPLNDLDNLTVPLVGVILTALLM